MKSKSESSELEGKGKEEDASDSREGQERGGRVSSGEQDVEEFILNCERRESR